MPRIYHGNLAYFVESKVYKEHRPPTLHATSYETILQDEPWKTYSPAELPDALVYYFDHPEKYMGTYIWIWNIEMLKPYMCPYDYVYPNNPQRSYHGYPCVPEKVWVCQHRPSNLKKLSVEIDGTFIAKVLPRVPLAQTYLSSTKTLQFMTSYVTTTNKTTWWCSWDYKSAPFLNQMTEMLWRQTMSDNIGGRITMNDALTTAVIDKLPKNLIP